MKKNPCYDRWPLADVGFDPVRWLERLKNVVEDSSFSQKEKTLIVLELSQLQQKLNRLEAQ